MASTVRNLSATILSKVSTSSDSGFCGMSLVKVGDSPILWGFQLQLGFGQKSIILGRESLEDLTPSDKENLRGRILQIFEEDENVEVYMEDDDGNIEFVGTNRANGNPTRGENGNRERRKHGETKRLSREEGGKLNTESSNERKRERRRRRSSENETNSNVKRKEGLFPPSVER